MKVIYLPPGPNDEKTGFDDYFARGGTKEDLPKFATDKVLKPLVDEEPECPYAETARGIVWHKPTTDGSTSVLLTNFTARIVTDIILDDGIETSRSFEIETTYKGRTARCEISSSAFASLNWVIEHLGAGAIVFPGFGTKDHTRAAIQHLSGDPPAQHIYTHTGWRKLDNGNWVYLHAGGAIGQITTHHIRVHLPPALAAFCLPEPPVGEDLKRAVRSSLRTWELGPERIFISLHAAAFRATLGATDFSVHQAGPSGTFKSESAALAQQHFGAGLDARHLPASWSSTANALEGMAFTAKDTLLTIDDYAPHGSQAEQQRLHGTADRVLRAQGNNAGRGRMRADASLRVSRPPRGLINSTGEDIPPGHSLRARQFILEMSPGDVDTNQLTLCQQDARAGLYAQAMAGFLFWLSSRYEQVQQSLRGDVEHLRAVTQGKHARTPEIIANLAIGLRYFLEFAEHTEAITDKERDVLWQRGWKALQEAGSMQAAHLAASEPAQRYIELLASAIASGRAHVAALDGNAPDTPEAWGWREARSGTTYPGVSWAPQGERIGWIENDDLYLNPDAAFNVAKRTGEAGGEGIVITPKTLSKRLKERGLLRTIDTNHGTLTVRKVAEGNRQKALHLHAKTIIDVESPQSPQSDQQAPPASQSNSQMGGFCGEILDADAGNLPNKSPQNLPSDALSTHTHAANGRIGEIGEITATLYPQEVQRVESERVRGEL